MLLAGVTTWMVAEFPEMDAGGRGSMQRKMTSSSFGQSELSVTHQTRRLGCS